MNVYCSSSVSKTAAKQIHDTFSEIENLFSPGATDLSSPQVLQLFDKALRVYCQTDGCFDLTVAPLSRIWGFWDGAHRFPEQEEISAVLNNIGMDKIKIKNGSLILLPEMELDWGGIAKGLGIDLASQSLMLSGITSGFINAGGDLYCWGNNPDGQPWQIGIQHPRKQGYFGILSISQVGAATTGDYQRYFIKGGIRYHHVFNPKTGYPARNKQSVTVIGPETYLCDALSTGLFVSSQPQKILRKFPDYGAVVLDSDGKLSILGKAYPFRMVD
jgi:thiamine biosynthesis lipoprotein